MKNQSTFSGLKTQIEVMKVLISREVLTQYGRNGLGFLWLFLEPMSFFIGISIIWSLLDRGSHLKQNDVIAFIVCGYGIIMLYRHCTAKLMNAIEPNRTLLFHKMVTVPDIFYSRVIIECLSCFASFFFTFIVFYLLGLVHLPENPNLMLLAWIFNCWFCACFGIILAALNQKNDIVEKIWHPLSYFMIPLLGVFGFVSWTPYKFRVVLEWSPMANIEEMFRAGYFGTDFTHFYFNWKFLLLLCILMTWAANSLLYNIKIDSN